MATRQNTNWFSGRMPGQAPEIDPVVYLTECDPSDFPSGSMIDVQIPSAPRATTWSPASVLHY